MAERKAGWNRWDTGVAVVFGLLTVGVALLARAEGRSPWWDLATVVALGPGSYAMARWIEARDSRDQAPDTVEAAVARVAARRARAEQDGARRGAHAGRRREPPARRLDEPPVETFR